MHARLDPGRQAKTTPLSPQQRADRDLAVWQMLRDFGPSQRIEILSDLDADPTIDLDFAVALDAVRSSMQEAA